MDAMISDSFDLDYQLLDKFKYSDQAKSMFNCVKKSSDIKLMNSNLVYNNIVSLKQMITDLLVVISNIDEQRKVNFYLRIEF